jgi:hypothetical protein
MFFVDLPEIHQAPTGGRSLGGHTVDAGCGPHASFDPFGAWARGRKASLAQNVTFITSRNSNFWHNLFGLKIAPAIFKSALLPRRSCGGAFFSSNHAIIWKAHES